jgi:hypothetical protein
MVAGQSGEQESGEQESGEQESWLIPHQKSG